MELWCCSAQHAAQQHTPPTTQLPHRERLVWSVLYCTAHSPGGGLCRCPLQLLPPPILQMEGGRMLYDAQCYESRPQHAVPACKKNMIAWLMHCC